MSGWTARSGWRRARPEGHAPGVIVALEQRVGERGIGRAEMSAPAADPALARLERIRIGRIPWRQHVAVPPLAAAARLDRVHGLEAACRNGPAQRLFRDGSAAQKRGRPSELARSVGVEPFIAEREATALAVEPFFPGQV